MPQYLMKNCTGQYIIFLIAAMALLCANDASAYMNPRAGRFVQRDPRGYVDGMNLYQYIRSNPTHYTDPWGMEATESGTECCCVTSGDCWLEYSSPRGATTQMGLQNYGHGYYQQFNKYYKVTLKSKSGKTGGCHIKQSATTILYYANAADAKPMVPGSFSPPVDPSGFFSTASGHTVYIFVPNDYDGTETYVNKDGDAEIDDTPGVFRSYPNFKDQLLSWSFYGNNEVKEVSAVRGSIEMHATFAWNRKPPMMSWTANSSDGKIKESR